MRLFVAIMAWAVLVLSILSALVTTLGAFAALQSGRVEGGAMAVILMNSSASALMRLVEAVALFAGLLFLLDVDKRLRTHGAARETL